MQETLNLEEASSFLKMSPSALRAKAKRGDIPASKPSKRWVFLREDLINYMRGLYLYKKDIGTSAWQKNSISEVTFGGSDSRMQELVRRNEEAQKLAKSRKHNVA